VKVGSSRTSVPESWACTMVKVRSTRTSVPVNSTRTNGPLRNGGVQGLGAIALPSDPVPLMKTIPIPGLLRELRQRRGEHRMARWSMGIRGKYPEELPLPVIIQRLTGLFGGLDARGMDAGLCWRMTRIPICPLARSKVRCWLVTSVAGQTQIRDFKGRH